MGAGSVGSGFSNQIACYRHPQGPTLTMRVHQYALMRDVAASQPRPRTSAAMFAAPPLLVMNQVLATSRDAVTSFWTTAGAVRG